MASGYNSRTLSETGDFCVEATFLKSILEIEPAQWDALWSSDYPFTKFGFLETLENSGSVDTDQSDDTGWQAQHLVIKEQDELIAAMPLFIKNHSYGEYVFDWSWADAYYQAGFDYYPKLVNAIPFTPSTGPRVAYSSVLSESARSTCKNTLVNAIKECLSKNKYSGFHSLFPCNISAEIFTRENMSQRLGYQFHWFNSDYKDFDDFLSRFSSRKRKSIKKERKKIFESPLQIKMRSAIDITQSDWDVFYSLYQRTYLKRSGRAGYLGPDFFHKLAATLPENVLLASAHTPDEMIAGAFYLRDEKTLYGRYWGTKMDIDGLHFECCYYQGIEYAIRNNIERFDPGAQGEHKIQRGFTPIKTHSFHHMTHPSFSHAIDQFVTQEEKHIDAYISDARTMLPFKEGEEVVESDILTREHVQ